MASRNGRKKPFQATIRHFIVLVRKDRSSFFFLCLSLLFLTIVIGFSLYTSIKEGKNEPVAEVIHPTTKPTPTPELAVPPQQQPSFQIKKFWQSNATYSLRSEVGQTKFYKDETPYTTTVLPVNSRNVEDFYFDERNEELYVIERTAEISGVGPEEIYSLNVKHPYDRKTVHFMLKPETWYGTSFVYAYSDGSLLMETHGGDGCGGGGEYWMLRGTSKQSIQTYEKGCQIKTPYPPYCHGFSYTTKLLYCSNRDYPPGENKEMDNMQLLNLYSINPITNERQTIIDTRAFPKNIKYSKGLNKDNDSIIFANEYWDEKASVRQQQDMYQYDTNTRQFSKL